MATDKKFSGTISAYPNFDPIKDAHVFVDNLRHIGGDENAIISVASSRSAKQRQEIVKRYKEMQRRELHDDLKLYTRFDFQRVLVASFMEPIHFDAWSLNDALEELGTDEKSLVEILISRSNDQIRKIRETYRNLYDHDVDAMIRRKTSGEFCHMLLMLATPSRDEGDEVPLNLVKRDAKALNRAIRKGEAIMKYTFNEIFCNKNFAYLRAMFDEYQKLTGKDILGDIRRNFTGHMKNGLKAITEYARYPPDYFAHRLYRCMKGLGTDDSSLTRILITRSEIDTVEIKECFQEKYGQTLEQFVMGDTSFSYRTMLLALIRAEPRRHKGKAELLSCMTDG